MKFKYFLRGLGTGIIFASLVCCGAFYTSDSKAISDKEVIERAKELGMVEKKDSVKDLFASDTEKTTEKSSKQDMESVTESETEENASEATTNDKKETSEKESGTEERVTNTTTEATSQNQTTEPKTEASTEKETEVKENEKKTVSITIKGGMSSYPVCRQLQELGLIKDASDFDAYLIKNGYANRISVGTHTLTMGMTYEEIAIVISDRR